MTIERARRFARAYLDEFGHMGEFEMTMPSELELEMVAAVFVKELDCIVKWNRSSQFIRVQMPWFKFIKPAMDSIRPEAGEVATPGYMM